MDSPNRPAVAVLALAILLAPAALAAPPSNDARASALAVSTGASVTGTTTEATLEAGEPRPCGGMAATVWYSVTPAESGLLILDTFGSAYDTVLAAYAPGGATALVCNDDTGGLQSEIALEVSAGSTYEIQLGGYNGATGSYVLNVGGTTNATVDLVATSVDVQGVVLEGRSFGVRTTLRNTGSQSAPNGFNVEFRIDGSAVRVDSFPPGMPPLYSFTFTAYLPGPAVGEHLLEAVVDVLDEVAEENESNNVVSATFVSHPPARVSIDILDLRRAPLETEAGDARHPLARHEADVEVCNAGPTPSGYLSAAFRVLAGADGSLGVGGAALPSRYLPDLLEGECHAFTLRFDTPGVVGDFTLVGTVWSENDVSVEDNEDQASSYNVVGGEGGVVVSAGVVPR